MAVTLGGVGCINFEVQALCYIEAGRTPEDRVFMLQFPAGRQAGLFCSNLGPNNNLVTGDSQVGSTGGDIGANPPNGVWCLLTFSADGTTGTSGLYRGTIQSLDGTTVPFSGGGRTKGVEASLQANRFDLNGAAAEFGWAGGIRFAEIRGYNAQRSDVQRQSDLTNLDPTGAVFWWRISNDGGGGVAVTDLTGNGRVPDLIIGSLATGPTI